MTALSKTICSAFLTAGLLHGSGCDSAEDDAPERISFDAVVQVFVIGEGPNTFVLRRPDSRESYYPLNLPREFQVEGLNVHVEGLLIKDYQVLLHPPVEIISITELAQR